MNKLGVNFENCYGISKFKHDFDFSEYHSHLIYAPNGIMKSSFAKVFNSYQCGNKADIKDRIFSNKNTSHRIEVDNKEINAETIFVIRPFEDSFHSENISEILLKEEHKKEYEKIVTDLKRSKRDFLQKVVSYFIYIQKTGDDLISTDMAKINHISKPEDVERLFVELFAEKEYNSELDFYETVLDIDKKLKEKEKVGNFSQIKYGVIFNEKTTGKGGFLVESRYRFLLKKYVERYKELIEESKYFNLNFTHTSAEKIVSQMEEAYYFDTQNKKGAKAEQNGFQLYNKQSNERDPKEKEELIEEIKKLRAELLNDKEFSKHLVAIDKALDAKSTKITKKFKEYIFDPDVVNFLSFLGTSDLDFAKRELIFSYLVDSGKSFIDFVDQTASAYKAIEDLVNRVRSDESSIWHKAVNEFNSRFRVPFMVSVSNEEKDKVLLNGLKLQSLEYWFCSICGADANRICEHEKKEMVQVSERNLTGDNEDSILSQGERRAFYLLNIIFEIKYRKENQIPTIFIIDDIADSFDYQNKYAIAEYLKEISDTSFFRSIILTHNFDFFRTLKQRLEIKAPEEEGDWYFLAEKRGDQIRLVSQKDTNIIDPFKGWRIKLSNCGSKDVKYIFASILMMRNLLHYSGAERGRFTFLTDIIHGRGEDFEEYTMESIQESLKASGLPQASFEPEVQSKKYYELLRETVSQIVIQDSLSLEDKIVVSLYIRTATEIYLRKKLGLEKTSNTSPRELVQNAVTVIPDVVNDLQRVNLITPEQIHINSFMYEPLIDLDKNQIVDLYEKVKSITG